MHIVNDEDAAVEAPESPKVVGSVILEFLDNDTFRIKWPETKVGYLDLYVKAAGIQVKLPNGEFGDIEEA